MATLLDLIGRSPAIVSLREQVAQLCRARPGPGRLPTILIEGETGTGKGLLARVLHGASRRAGGPFVDVNCAAIPDTLLEAELFGFERGAFTDARQEKPGLFEAAHLGTLFLDEIGLLPAGAQAKLLKAIEEKVVRRLGGTRERPVDAWLLCATNASLAAAVRAGRVREDLYHRLAVVTLTLPPLRERGRDVVLLAEHFLARACAEYGVPAKALLPEAARALEAHRWPGNVRELANVMERVALLGGEPRVTPGMLDLSGGQAVPEPAEPDAGNSGETAPGDSLRDTLGAVERERLLRALSECDWNISQAAARLGLPRGTLRYRIARHGLAPGSGAPALRGAGEPPAGREAPPRRETPRTNLPRVPSTFVGRERETARVTAALASAPLVTVTGAGGVGKTRLALEVALALQSEFAHGAWLVDLAALADPERVPHAVATALGLREQPGRPVDGALLDFLRPKHLLLLLDNCEHLLPAVAALADRMLRQCPDVRILATSREGLGVGGESLQVLRPLDLPPAGLTVAPEEAGRFEAVRLFAERARGVRPGFRVDARNAEAVVEICRRLDGIPLAIELAAARMGAMAAQEIAVRLDDRFRLLTGGSRTALPRHQTLRGALDWSHVLLSDGERVLFRRLGVFAGGFTLEAAERVGTGGPVARADAADLLARLVERSLVVFAPGATRYRLLETVRQYAQGLLLDAGETQEVRGAHLAYYLDLAERAEPLLRGPDQMAWLDALGLERDNLRAALEWSVTGQEPADSGVRLAGALHWFWYIRGPVHEGRQWLERALARPGGSQGPRARALAALGMLAWREDHFGPAREALEESLALAEAGGDLATAGFALHHLAHIFQMVGGFDQAVETFEASVARYRVAEEPWGRAWSMRCLGDILRRQGIRDRAGALLEEALDLCRRSGDRWVTSRVLFSLAALAVDRDECAWANALLEESLAIGQEAGDSYSVFMTQRELGKVAMRQGETERAAALYRASLEGFRETGERYESARVLDDLAALTLALDRPAQAARILGATDAVRRVIGTALDPADRPARERTATAAREALGADGFDAAFAQGAGMSVEAIVAEVWPGPA
jgi:non-specific serine/threonine protein kinase